MISFIKRIFSGKLQPEVKKTIASKEEFPKLSVGERVRQVMFCGDLGDHYYYPMMKYAILSDPGKDVKMAALKRIHLFVEHPDTIPFMKGLEEQIDIQTVEPYYSMALSRLNIITEDEFRERANKWV